MMTAMKKKLSKFSILICIIMLFASIRVFMLEKDIPSWNISTLQPMDEYYYGAIAFNLYHYNNINPDTTKVANALESMPPLKGTLIYNTLIFASLKLLGNNYYGLRVPAVLCSLLSMILMLIILNRIKKDDFNEVNHEDKFCKRLILFALFYMSCDFTFLLMSRICEPVIFRMAFIMVTLYVLHLFNKSNRVKLGFFIFGALSTLSFLLVYTVNFFAFAAAGAAVGVYLLLTRNRKSVICAILFLLGVVSAILIVNLYYKTLWNDSLYSTIKNTFSLYGGRVSSSEVVGLKGKLLTYYGRRDIFLSANIFMYSPVLLFALLTTLPVSIYKAIKTKSITDIFLVSLVIMMYFQTIFLDDYTRRKATTVLPFIIICIFSGLIYFNNFLSSFRNKVKFANIFAAIYIILCGWITYNEPIMSFTAIHLLPKTLNDSIFFINISSLVLAIILSLAYILKGMKFNKLVKLLCTLIVVPGILLSSKYVYFYNNYSEKNIMIEVGKIVGNNYVLGGFPHSFSLYNSIIPVMNAYDVSRGQDEFREMFNNYIKVNNVRYFLGYAEEESKMNEAYFENNPEYEFKEIKKFERNFEENGKKTYISVYLIVKK